MKEKSFVIVGGSSGIGWAILQNMSAEGACVLNLSGASRLPEELPGITHNPFDAVSDPFRQIVYLSSWTDWYTVPAVYGCGLLRG